MRVKIPIEFDIEPEDDEGFDERVARDAAELAAFDYLSFVKVSGESTDTDEVEVFVDGFGTCRVSLVAP